MSAPNLILIGFSYTGKSRAGETCAAKLGWRLIDTDELIKQQAGETISAIFERQGESYFRNLESGALREACLERNAVIATGGGAVIDPGNRALLHSCGVVVCLEARPETILQRLEQEQSLRGASETVRPLLNTPDPLTRIRALKEHRQVFYATADWTVHTDWLIPARVALEVMRGYKTVAKAKDKQERRRQP
ncbi:MAG: shikimate kinase [Dehalococcoidia bacterium]|nr:shikimate kinase [Dehalococcoidia bacterium]